MSHFSRDAIRHICAMACPGGDFESDEELLRAFIERHDADAFAAIVRRHGRLVMRVCRQALFDAHDAEDAFQATFLLLVRKAESIYRHEVLGSWLYGVAHRVATRLRAQNRQRCTRERPMANLTVGAPPPTLDAGELWTVLHEEVLRLPLKYRLPVVLCYLEGKTHEEAGRQLGWPTGTVAGRLARARDLLHRRLTRRGVAAPAAAGVALLLWSGSAPATVATDLVRGTVATAMQFASGAPAAGSVSTTVLTLTEGVLKTMLLTKIKNITTLLALACFAAFTIGAGFSAAGSNKGSSGGDDQKNQASEPQGRGAPAKRRPRPPQGGNSGLDSAEAERLYTDLKDDTLPAEARARFGNLRFLHPSNVGALAYSGDGKLLASAATDGTVCVWDTANGKLLQTFNRPGPDGALPPGVPLYASAGGVAFSGDGKVLGAVLAGRGLCLWDMTTGKEIRTLFAGTQNLTSFVMSRDAKLVYPVTEASKTIELYDTATGKVVKTLTGHTQNVNSVAFSSDGKWLVSGSEDQTIRIWDLETEKQKHVIEAHREGVKAVTVAPDDKSIASLSYDNTARVFDAGTLEEICRIEGRTNTTAILRSPGSANLALSADGKYLASFALGWPPRLHEIPSGKEIYQFDLSNFGYGSMGMAFRPDGKVIAHAASAGRIRFYDTATGKPIEEGTGHTGTPLCLAVSPDGKTLVSGGTDRTLRFWDLATNKEVRVLRAHTGPVSFVAITPDGKHVISASTDAADKVVSVWNAASGKEETPIRFSGLPLVSVAISPDGRKLCTTTQDNKTHVWDIEARKEITSIQTVRWGFPSMPFTPDSKGLLNLTYAGLVVLDIETGKEVRTLMPITGPAQGQGAQGGVPNQLYSASLFSSTDGTLAMRYNFDGTMQMVDMTSGSQLAEFEEKLTAMAPIPPRFVMGPTVAISPDGKTVATSWKNSSIRLWETATGKVRHTFPGHAGSVSALAFTRDGKTLVSAATDSTILVWNVAAAPPAEPLSDAELEKQWKALAADAPSGFDAVRTLAAAGQKATGFLKEHVQAVKPIDDKTVAALLADLDSEDFDKRKSAAEELTNQIDQVAPALRKALEAKPSLETTQRLESILQTIETRTVSGPQARDLRVIEVLEQCGTAEAREVLGTLAKGAQNARVTREAKAALARLDAAREKKD